jgi:hypothetical protein
LLIKNEGCGAFNSLYQNSEMTPYPEATVRTNSPWGQR